MAPTLNTKLTRETTAAFAASQPLLDKLIRAVDVHVAKQRANLELARDLVQVIHIKLPTTHAIEQARYIDSIVAAYRSALLSYKALFEELVNITKANLTEGKGARREFQKLSSILKGIEQSEAAAAAGIDKEEQVNTNGITRSSSDSNHAVPQRSVTEHASLRQNAPQIGNERKRPRNSEGERHDQPSRKSQKLDRDSPNDRERQSRQPPSTTWAAGEGNTTPDMQYLDISGEVEARIKEKAEKKAAKATRKQEKKRKRESGHSNHDATEPIISATAAEEPRPKRHCEAGDLRADGDRGAEEGKHDPVQADLAPQKSIKRKSDTQAKHEVGTDPASGSRRKKRKKDDSLTTGKHAAQ